MMPRKQTETYYHCTFAKSLPGIAKRGLVPAAVPGLRQMVRGGNIRGVYLSSKDGIRFWFNGLVRRARSLSENPAQEGFVPIVLRVETSCDVVEDVLGAQDSWEIAVICRRQIPPGALRVWDGTSWVPTSRGVDASLGAEWVEDEDHVAGGFWALLDSDSSALMPGGPRLPSGFAVSAQNRRDSRGNPRSRKSR